jgi:alkaline phosphatase
MLSDKSDFRLPTSDIRLPLYRSLIVSSALAILASPAGAQKRVILFIGDGVGASHWTAARIASPESLAVSRLKVMGLIDTRSSNSLITDSGAGATAYASGVRTYNYAIGVGPDSQPVETVLEAAKKNGWATGLVATSSITHATPAAFASHVRSRASEFEIAKQMTAVGPDVLLGAGRRFFSPATRPDREDLIGQLRTTHTVVTEASELEALRDTSLRRLVGLFAEIELPRASERSPTLPAMTRKAIEILSRDPDGFFLMVEGSQPDWRAHDNDPIGDVIDEMLEFDAAIGVALEYQRRVPDALVLVVADHETGGLALELARDSAVLTAAASALEVGIRALGPATPLLSRQSADSADSAATRMQITAARLRNAARGARTERLFADYTTGGHTAQMVPLFAAGNGAEAFGGMIDNYRVGQMLLEIVRRPPAPRRRRE